MKFNANQEKKALGYIKYALNKKLGTKRQRDLLTRLYADYFKCRQLSNRQIKLVFDVCLNIQMSKYN